MEGKFLEPILHGVLPWLYLESYAWTIFGFAGNLMFTSRFILQWARSEKEQQLIVPPMFWHLSFWGSVINVLYALHLDSAPLIVGTIALPFVYGRNLVLLKRCGNQTRVETESDRRPVGIPGKPAIAG